MRTPQPAAGFTLIEVLSAMTLLAIILSALASGLIASQHASAANQNLMRAVLLAAETLEQARGASQPVEGGGNFQRSLTIGAADAEGLRRADATVRWSHRGEHSLTLSTLLFDRLSED